MNSTTPARILLAEDNPSDVLLVREALREQKIDCVLHTIADGEAAMNYIDQLDLDSKSPCPDLLLIDLHLPKRDGQEIIRRLRASERCGQVPVIVLTGSYSPDDRQAAEKNAVLHYFRKSPSIDTFMEIGALVRQALEGRA
jgi:chemotaxis family two-component system response regulator Rcp1